ncbi:MAG: holo-ACP synthase [Victivallales bacterium]|nr:holo-ACP synthase [Victivallales bacterium]
MGQKQGGEMIVGTGIDIVECDRLEKSLDKFGQSFVDYFCTAAEQAAAPSNPHARLVYFAARWAAKEACAKALGTGFGADFGWKDIEVEKIPSGQPTLRLNGKAKETANKLGINRFHLSSSHVRHYATAIVIADKDS